MAFNFGSTLAKPTSGFSFGGAAAAAPTTAAPTSAFGSTQPTFGAAQPSTFGTSQPSAFGGFGGAKPTGGATFGTFGGNMNTNSTNLPQPVTLSQQDLYLSPEEHAKRLSADLEKQAMEFQEISTAILEQDQRNYQIFNQLEQFTLLLEKLTAKQHYQRQEISKISGIQQQIYQELSTKPKNPNAKVAQVARLMVEVEAQIEAVSVGSVETLRDIQEQACVLENLKGIGK